MTRLSAIAGGVENYYRLHARVYDQTRWAFLFGRHEILNIAAGQCQPEKVLEIGCGTGHNLSRLRSLLPTAELHGLDLSVDMLGIARRRLGHTVTLWDQAYEQPLSSQTNSRGFDLIVTSYALSMFNPGWQQAIDALCHDLRPGGHLALVDFHDTPFNWFREWMSLNHVRMDGHLINRLQEQLTFHWLDSRPAYAGLWRYSMLIATKRLAN